NHVYNNLEIKSPMDGSYLSLEDIADTVFAEKMMGEGFGIDPSHGEVVAPVDGVIMQVFPTNHAVGIKTNNGAEVVIHIGLETVAMEGKGFEGFVSVVDRIEVGDKLVTFDIDLVMEEANSTISPVIITTSNEIPSFDIQPVSDTVKGETVVVKAAVK